jgi:hypothetical protein
MELVRPCTWDMNPRHLAYVAESARERLAGLQHTKKAPTESAKLWFGSAIHN